MPPLNFSFAHLYLHLVARLLIPVHNRRLSSNRELMLWFLFQSLHINSTFCVWFILYSGIFNDENIFSVSFVDSRLSLQQAARMKKCIEVQSERVEFKSETLTGSFSIQRIVPRARRRRVIISKTCQLKRNLCCHGLKHWNYEFVFQSILYFVC